MPRKRRPVETTDPAWIKGELSGFDAKTGKYRSYKGPFVRREKALEEAYPHEVYGALSTGNLTPISRAAEQLEAAIAGVNSPSQLTDWLKDTQQTIRAIPASILARMKLAEYYAMSEGDVFQTIEIPIEVGLRFEADEDVKCADKGAEKDLRAFYSDQGIDLYEVLYNTWLSTAIYGSAFPLQIFPRVDDKPEGRFDHSRPPGIVCLNPKTVWVGRVYSMSQWDAAITEEEVEKWDENMLEKTIPPVMYVALVMRDNEMLQMGKIPINPEWLHVVHDKKLTWERYAIPHLSRAFRAISTRQVLEEMIRATIEGYKNQLWVFKLGSDARPASPQKIKKLNELVNSLNAERTGQLIFTHDLTVEQHTPKPLDQLLANEAWMALTFHMFTQLGMNPYFISGIRQGRGSSSTLDIDVAVMVERVKFWHRQLQRLERNIRGHWCDWESVSEKVRTKVMDAKVGIGRIDLGAAEIIKNRLQPLVQMGLLSTQTSLEEAGYNYELELARKQDEEADSQLFTARPSYNQTFTSPGGGGKTSLTSPQGRPKEGTKNADQGVRAAVAAPFRPGLAELPGGSQSRL